MTVVAYYPLHYGAEFLDISIRSIRDHVSLIYILYTSQPTYGHKTNIICPETEADLKQIAENAAPGKISWHDVTTKRFNNEGAHRNFVFNLLDPSVTQVICIDADEVWEPSSVSIALKEASMLPSRNIAVNGFIHFWKSTQFACLDHFTPIRIINVHAPKNTQSTITSTIYHFGYCQSHTIMEYKWLIHGHKNELKPEWRELFLNWNPENYKVDNVHPCINGLWNPRPYDTTTLPLLIQNHPIFTMNYFERPASSMLYRKPEQIREIQTVRQSIQSKQSKHTSKNRRIFRK